ncbi:MAG: hypothetical protein LUD74_00735 [Tannerellaceae bacterium]|nr:hypothetical protein [Tannerellaceae bacterium]
MEYQLLLRKLDKAIRQKFPEETNRIRLLAGMLDMKPNTLYRKLRGERPLSWDEVVRVTHALSVSLQELTEDSPCVEGGVPAGRLPVQDGYPEAMSDMGDIFSQAAGSGYSKFTGVCRSLPVMSCLQHEWLLKMAHLKWLYFSNRFAEMPSFSQLGDMERFRDVKRMYVEAFASIRHLNFVVDGDMIRNFTLDLAFFRKIHLITQDELMFILEDVEDLLRVAEEVCQRRIGEHPGQDIQIFYSDMPFHNDIYLVKSTDINCAVFYAQGFNPVIHRDAQRLDAFQAWVQGWIRCSNPICGIAPIDRQAFFERQRAIVEDFRREHT